jgi:hypothetical protein
VKSGCYFEETTNLNLKKFKKIKFLAMSKLRMAINYLDTGLFLTTAG